MKKPLPFGEKGKKVEQGLTRYPCSISKVQDRQSVTPLTRSASPAPIDLGQLLTAYVADHSALRLLSQPCPASNLRSELIKHHIGAFTAAAAR